MKSNALTTYGNRERTSANADLKSNYDVQYDIVEDKE